jgi:hypothetical protein
LLGGDDGGADAVDRVGILQPDGSVTGGRRERLARVGALPADNRHVISSD